MNHSACSIGLDIGTTSVKALVVDGTGQVLLKAGRRLTTTTDEYGMAIQDPLEIASEVTSALAEVVRQATEKGLMLARVGFSAAMHSLLAVSEDGTPLTEAFTWMDVRAKREAEELWTSEKGRTLYRETGTPTHAMAPVVKLLWLRSTRQDIWACRPRFVSIKEWIWHRWFGEWKIDESMAGATGLYDMEKRAWNDGALSVTGLGARQLSEIVPTTYVRSGLTDKELLSAGLTAETRFNVGSSDGVLANIALGVTDESAMVLTVGTSLAVRTGSTAIVTDESFRPFCYPFAKDRYIVGAPSNSGGIVLDWLMRQVFGYGDDAEAVLGRLSGEAKDANIAGLHCLPYAAGERAPLWNESARASFIGLNLGHRQVHLLRAAIEGVLFNAYSLVARLAQRTGTPNRVILSGKMFDEPWICQFCADLFGIPVQSGNLDDASTLGAVVLAMRADGMDDEMTFHDEGEPFHPNAADTAILRERFTEYQNLCEKLL